MAAYSTLSLADSTSSDVRVSSLILIDPVDDIERHTLQKIDLYPIDAAPLPPTIIISTPYGGSSNYYKSAVFESVCAPPDRGPRAFYETLSKRDEKENSRFLKYVEFKHIGHLELLDDSEDLVFASLCPVGGNADEEKILSKKSQIDEIVRFIVEAIKDY